MIPKALAREAERYLKTILYSWLIGQRLRSKNIGNVANQAMTREKVLEELRKLGGKPGKTASEGSKDWERAARLDFRKCPCSFADDSYAGKDNGDYIAATSGKPLYIGINEKGTISCGTKGFHHYRGGQCPAIV